LSQALESLNYNLETGETAEVQLRALGPGLREAMAELEHETRLDPGGECKALFLRILGEDRKAAIALLAALEERAAAYEEIRRTMAPGPARAARMNAWSSSWRRESRRGRSGGM